MITIFILIIHYKCKFSADNTYPNVIPLLTGLNVSEFEMECTPYRFFDDCYFIWKDFVSKGYQNVFGEDCGYIALFNLYRNGFRKQPTDYFFNTFIVEVGGKIAHKKIGLFDMCLGDQKPNEVMFKYIEKLIKTKIDEKLFSFFWTSTMTHEFINYPILLDDDLSDLLIKMEEQGYLNKTVLLLLSDHGIRYGDFRETNQGMIEERQPLLYFVLPKWFKKTYPEAHKNLKINTRRLTTPFDIYETMQDLLDPDLLKRISIHSRSKELLNKLILPRASSLFLQVSPNRTCETAGIASHWCTCFERKEISISDKRTQKAATFVVEYINDLLLNYTKCIKLSLNSISFANLEVSSDNFNVNIEKNQTLYDLIIGIEVKPSLAKFEATVRFSNGNKKLQILGTISRINKYGNQSHCIRDKNLKLYCFCKT